MRGGVAGLTRKRSGEGITATVTRGDGDWRGGVPRGNINGVPVANDGRMDFVSHFKGGDSDEEALSTTEVHAGGCLFGVTGAHSNGVLRQFTQASKILQKADDDEETPSMP